MWWLFGLLNVVIVLGFAWFYHKKIKEETVWVREEKIALGTLIVLVFLSGFLGTLVFFGLLGYFIIDFIKFIRK